MNDQRVILSSDKLSIDACFSFINDIENGGNCLFVGTVRGKTQDQVTQALEFESFESMAQKELDKIAASVIQEFGPAKCFISHRLGETLPGDIVVIIGVSTAHRKSAFKACEYAIDTLKEKVPIWKKEILEDGSFWVNAHP
jgi:molybdopterin synthase catalytic subunit